MKGKFKDTYKVLDINYILNSLFFFLPRNEDFRVTVQVKKS